MLDGRFVYSMPSAYPRIDFRSIDFSLVLADVGDEFPQGVRGDVCPIRCGLGQGIK